VTVCDCEECLFVRANLGHLRGDELLPLAIEKHFGSLALLTDEAFRALLPAFLFQALRDLSNDNKILEWTLYVLCPVYDEADPTARSADADLRRRISSFTEQQRAAVRAFLTLASTAAGISDGHRYAIAHALSTVWG
jgi:hypothetical protein